MINIIMYAKGMTTRQISETIEDIYGFETSESFISDVTDRFCLRLRVGRTDLWMRYIRFSTSMQSTTLQGTMA